jgi:hypothetical protein
MNDRFDNLLDSVNVAVQKHSDWVNEQLERRDTAMASLLKTVMDGFNEVKEQAARFESDLKCLEVQIQDINTRFQDVETQLSSIREQKQDRPWRELR